MSFVIHVLKIAIIKSSCQAKAQAIFDLTMGHLILVSHWSGHIDLDTWPPLTQPAHSTFTNECLIHFYCITHISASLFMFYCNSDWIAFTVWDFNLGFPSARHLVFRPSALHTTLTHRAFLSLSLLRSVISVSILFFFWLNIYANSKFVINIERANQISDRAEHNIYDPNCVPPLRRDSLHACFSRFFFVFLCFVLRCCYGCFIFFHLSLDNCDK